MACAALLWASAPSHAQDDGAQAGPVRNGYDVDIDIIRPIFGSDILPGVDLPATERPGTFRAGLVMGYTRNPLVLYDFEERVGPVVADRISAWAGASIDITRAFTLRAVVPMYLQYGSEIPRYASDGFAIGDISVGGHVALFRRPAGGFGLGLDVFAPTSRAGFYAGERLPRFRPSLLAMGDVGRLRIGADIGGLLRFVRIDTTEEFSLGSEIDARLGFRYEVLPDRLKLGLTGYARFGFVNLLGAAESTGEALLTFAYKPIKWLWLDVSAGRGFTQGYGSSDFRGLLQLRFQRLPRPEDEPETFLDPDGTRGDARPDAIFNVRSIGDIRALGEAIAPPEIPGLTTVQRPEEEWPEADVIARIDEEMKQIRIRYALQFRVGTSTLLPESYTTLDAVADLMNRDARIGHVVIEGHASPDGPFERNYTLSVERAQSIWRRLVEQGVHPSRLSFRGMGEVMPVEDSGGEDELQQSRRVIFHIVSQYGRTDQPDYRRDMAYPWSGRPYQPVIPSFPDDDDAIGIGELPSGAILEEVPVDIEFGRDDDIIFDITPDDVEIEPGDQEDTEEEP